MILQGKCQTVFYAILTSLRVKMSEKDIIDEYQLIGCLRKQFAIMLAQQREKQYLCSVFKKTDNLLFN